MIAPPAPKTTTTTPTSSSAAFAKNLLNPNSHEASFEETEDVENTSVSSSVSSLTNDEDVPQKPKTVVRPPSIVTTTTAPSAKTTPVSSKPNRRRNSKFTVTPRSNNSSNPANATNASSSHQPKNDAVSISFLSQPPPSGDGNGTGKAKPALVKQVIQKALVNLRPGGVFFVLDYKEDEPTEQIPTLSTSPTSARSSSLGGNSASDPAPSPSSPASSSRAMKEIPEELLQQWNLTMVPTNLEMYYNQKYANSNSCDANNKNNTPRKNPLPAASQRIVRWMGIKPNNITTATRGPQAN